MTNYCPRCKEPMIYKAGGVRLNLNFIAQQYQCKNGHRTSRPLYKDNRIPAKEYKKGDRNE